MIRGIRFFLVVTYRISKLVRTIYIKKITVQAVARAFVTQLVWTYGPSIWLLSDNGTPFTSRFFQKTFRISVVSSTFTKIYHPQGNVQTERINRTILQGMRHYVADHPTDWDLYTGTLRYAYNTQMHYPTTCLPFEQALSRTLHSLATAPILKTGDTPTKSHYIYKWKNGY